MSSVLVALRRLREDRAPAIGLGLLILVTATVFGLAPRLIDRVGDDALHGVVAATTAFGRNVDPPRGADPARGRGRRPARERRARGRQARPRIPASVRRSSASAETVVDSVRFEVQTDTPDPSFIRFRIQPGADQRIHYVAGVAPTAATERIPLPEELRRFVPQDEPPSTDQIDVTVLQTAVSVEAAAALDKGVGDLLFLSFDGRDPLAQRQLGVVAARITGTFEVDDAADPFWFEDQSLNHVTIRTLGGDSRLLDIGALPARPIRTTR